MALDPTLAKIRRNLPGVARSLGFAARVTSAYRSPAKQAKLYQRYLAGLMPYPVAPPGTSDHERGLALDVVSTDTEKLVTLLTSAGLRWAGEADPVHFTFAARKSQATAKSDPYKAWASEVGTSIPGFLDYLPGVGEITRVLSDPAAEADSGLDALLTAILGPL